VLYAARDYARFRKQFYFDLVSGDDGYLSLLLQLQAIRNLEANLQALEQNLRTHEALARAGIASQIQVDLVFQTYQTGRLRLIRARNNLANSLDAYKLRLGLPMDIEVELDDSLLRPFELNSREITQLQSDIDQLLSTYREMEEAPSREQLTEGFAQLQSLHEDVAAQWTAIGVEWQAWHGARSAELPEDSMEREAQQTLKSRLEDLEDDLDQVGRRVAEAAAAAHETDRDESWRALQRIARQAYSLVGNLFVIQSQIRTYAVEIDAGLTVDDAVSYALNNRLDLMNQRAQVVDEWRKNLVAADGLEADLEIVGEAVVGTDPDSSNPARFTSDDSRFRAGIRVDGPLNRQLERNIYRTQLINYQRARRRLINRRDQIIQAVRRDLRSLQADRLNFEIARQSLIVAARQVELAQIELLAPRQESDSNTTRDALAALSALLDSKDALISVWVSYETDRLRLLWDTEALQLDERGLPQNGHFDEPDSLEPIDPGAPVISADEY
jgi:hypothetical protein